MTVVERYRTDDFWEDRPTFRRTELFAAAFSNLLQLPARQVRNAPLAVEFPLEVVQQTTVRLPEGLLEETLDQQDMEMTLDTPAFFFNRHIENTESALTVTHQYRSRADHVAMGGLDQHYAAVKQARDALSVVLLTPTSAQARAAAREERLQKALRRLMEKNGDD